MNEPQIISALAALAQKTRLRIFRLLIRAGHDGLCVHAIAEKVAAAPATLSFHLKTLTQSGLVTAQSEGRYIRYSAHYEAMTALLRYLTEHCCGGLDCQHIIDGVDPARRCSPPKRGST